MLAPHVVRAVCVGIALVGAHSTIAVAACRTTEVGVAITVVGAKATNATTAIWIKTAFLNAAGSGRDHQTDHDENRSHRTLSLGEPSYHDKLAAIICQ